MTSWLFSYGSNHPDQLTTRVGPVDEMVAAYASGYRRVFRGWSERWQGGVATLIKAKHTTFGYIARVTTAQLREMDRYEGVASGKYKRASVTVNTAEHGRVKAVVYLATSKTKSEPSRAYLEAVAKTVGAFWADVTWRSFSTEW